MGIHCYTHAKASISYKGITGRGIFTFGAQGFVHTFQTDQRARIGNDVSLESVWDCGGNFVEDNTLTVYMKRLREKLGNAVHIETVRGIGYRAD